MQIKFGFSRSSCKKCTEVIPAKSLRLGSIRKERGNDMTRWYHPTCFPTDSKSIYVDEIDGFSSLEVRKTDETIMDKGKESSSKKLKVAELEIAFSISDVQKQYKESTLESFPNTYLSEEG